jgi:hypothetical protein
VFATDVSKAIVTVPAALPAKATELLTWANGLPSKASGKERNAAALLIRQHEIVLPGWLYGTDDLTEYRHAGVLCEFGWELLPP